MKASNIKIAFTLAEVLITLVIIGVIATISVPILFANYQKEATLSKLKKAYSTLAQTTNRAIADHGPVANWEVSANNSFNAAQEATDKYLTPYLNIMKKCQKNDNNKECKLEIKGLNGQDVSNSKSPSNSSYRFYLADGTLISTYAAKESSRNRLIITIDINGQASPNRLGRDIFRLEYYMGASNNYAQLNGKFLPTYASYSRNDIKSNKNDRCNKKQNGDACFALIFNDGWQIKRDYPW